MCDNSSLLPAGRPDRTGGGKTMTKGLRRDGSINTDARKLWTKTSYKEPAEPETPTKPGTGGGTVTPPSGGGGGGGTVAPPAGGGGGGGGTAVPPAETQKPEEPTQSGTTTTADLSGSTTSQGGQTTTTVDQTTADKLVETAVSGKSEEIVISAVTKNTSAALSVKSSEVALPVKTLQKIADKTNADIVIKTDVAEVKLDNKAAEAVAAQTHSETAGKAETVSIAVEKVKEAAKEVHYELKVVTLEGKTISDFKGGSVSVTVNVPKSLSNKKVVCVYIDGQGNYHKVAGKLNADGTYTFTTGHFSAYAVMPEEEADAAIAAQKAAVKQIKLKLSSKLVNTKSGKKGIRITWKNPSDIKLEGVEIYRSLKKNSGYGKKPISTPRWTPVMMTFSTVSALRSVSIGASIPQPARSAASVRLGVMSCVLSHSARIACTYSSVKQPYSAPLSPSTGSTTTMVSSPAKSRRKSFAKCICSTEPKKPMQMPSNLI